MVNFEWWYVHLGVVATFVVWMLWIFAGMPLKESMGYVLLAPTFIFGFGSFFAIYHDTRQLKKRDARWQPSRTIWMLANLVLSPWFTSPLYLTMRVVRLNVLGSSDAATA